MDDKKSNDELKERINALESLLSTLIKEKEESKAQDDASDDSFESIKIAQEEYIKVMSLCPMELNLSTEGMGRGKRFKFDKFGDIKRILYSDLVDIMENNSNFLNYGFYYIMDKRVIRKHGLDEAYEKILDKEKIEKILSFNEKESVDLFKSSNQKQKELITDMIVAKIRDSQDVDLNIIDRISRIAGFNLQKMGEESKEYSSLIAA